MGAVPAEQGCPGFRPVGLDAANSLCRPLDRLHLAITLRHFVGQVRPLLHHGPPLFQIFWLGYSWPLPCCAPYGLTGARSRQAAEWVTPLILCRVRRLRLANKPASPNITSVSEPGSGTGFGLGVFEGSVIRPFNSAGS